MCFYGQFDKLRGSAKAGGFRGDPHPGCKDAQREFNISEQEMYKTFNTEHILLIGTENPGRVIYTIESHGYKAREIGEIEERGDTPPLTVNGQNYTEY